MSSPWRDALQESSASQALLQLADDVAGIAAYISRHTGQPDEQAAFGHVAARWGKDFPQDG